MIRSDMTRDEYLAMMSLQKRQRRLTYEAEVEIDKLSRESGILRLFCPVEARTLFGAIKLLPTKEEEVEEWKSGN